MVRMSQAEVRRIVVTESRLEDIVHVLGLKAGNTAMIAAPNNRQDEPDMVIDQYRTEGHLTDELFVDFSLNRLPAAARNGVERHLASCGTCSEEADRLKQISSIWESEPFVVRLEDRARAALNTRAPKPRRAVGNAIAALVQPFVVSLRPLIRPQGAYGEAREEETSTLEFPVTQDGKIVEGLRGLLKRVNREYYVRIFAIDPGARNQYGDRKAVIDISDAHHDRPILHRRIDIGVTVLLGTDFRLTDSSCLAVEMLPAYHHKVNA
jgi:hypothetical protein